MAFNLGALTYPVSSHLDLPNPVFGQFKKVYEFIWMVQIPGIKYDKSIYISNLAQKVSLMDDNLNIRSYDYGKYKLDVATGIDWGSVSVNYLDDPFETVYNTHRNWLINCQRSDRLLENMYGRGYYSNALKVQSPLDIAEQSTAYMQGTLGSVVSSIFKIVRKFELPIIIPMSTTKYWKIYPVNISRTEADKSGDGLSGVTVTYNIRISVRLLLDWQMWKNCGSDDMYSLGQFDAAEYSKKKNKG